MACKGRPERCLLFCPDTLGAQEISELHSRQHLLPVHLPPIQSGVSPLGLYQDPQTSHSSRERAGDADDSLYRRHPPLGKIRGEGSGPSRGPSLSPTMPGLHDQSGEDDSRAIPEHGIPGIHGRHQENGTELTSREAQEDLGGVPKTNGGRASDRPHPFETDRQDECCQPGHPPVPLFYRTLQMELSAALREADQDYEATIMLSEDSKEELVLWDTEMVKWNGRTILAQEPHMVIESDASKLGWGASYQGISTGGPWSAQEKSQHINCLELLAATLALQTFVKNERDVSVLLKIDNTAAVAYINNQGGTVSKELVSLTRKLWMWCLERNIHIQAQHLPGVMNLTADAELRVLRDRSDWKLDQQCLRTTGSGSLCIPTEQSVPPLLQLAV